MWREEYKSMDPANTEQENERTLIYCLPRIVWLGGACSWLGRTARWGWNEVRKAPHPRMQSRAYISCCIYVFDIGKYLHTADAMQVRVIGIPPCKEAISWASCKKRAAHSTWCNAQKFYYITGFTETTQPVSDWQPLLRKTPSDRSHTQSHAHF